MDAFVALSDPTRRRIVQILSSRPRSAGEISARFSVSPQAISQHLKALRQAGLIRVHPLAQQRIYRLNPTGLRRVHRWLARYHRFWNASLDSLETALRKDVRAKGKPKIVKAMNSGLRRKLGRRAKSSRVTSTGPETRKAKYKANAETPLRIKQRKQL